MSPSYGRGARAFVAQAGTRMAYPVDRKSLSSRYDQADFDNVSAFFARARTFANGRRAEQAIFSRNLPTSSWFKGLFIRRFGVTPSS